MCLRSWYERNKHIFPASRWEPYDPTKNWDKYTVCAFNRYNYCMSICMYMCMGIVAAKRDLAHNYFIFKGRGRNTGCTPALVQVHFPKSRFILSYTCTACWWQLPDDKTIQLYCLLATLVIVLHLALAIDCKYKFTFTKQYDQNG